jgi:SAM-dependent methyltransferase
MEHEAMEPYGHALIAYHRGGDYVSLLIRRDDGKETLMPVDFFFRTPPDIPLIEKEALDLCGGRVLDVGAGTGVHALALQERGLDVTAIDICPEAVEIMRERGVSDARLADIFEFTGGSYRTILMLGHGIGIAGDLEGLDRLLSHALTLLSRDGQMLLDSMDVRETSDEAHLDYHERNRRSGRYFGINRIQFEFGGRSGPYCSWLHVDPKTLEEHAEQVGLKCEILVKREGGNYLARLTRRQE